MLVFHPENPALLFLGVAQQIYQHTKVVRVPGTSLLTRAARGCASRARRREIPQPGPGGPAPPKPWPSCLDVARGALVPVSCE